MIAIRFALLGFTAGFIFFYLAGAFIEGSINAMDWTEEGRLFTVGLSMMAGAVSAGLGASNTRGNT